MEEFDPLQKKYRTSYTMSYYEETCPACNADTSPGLYSAAEKCSYEGSPEGYAATEPILSQMMLPVSRHGSVMYSGSGRNQMCSSGMDSVSSTIEAVSHSLKTTNVFVHVTDSLGPPPSLLLSSTHVHASAPLVICILIDNESGDGESVLLATSAQPTPASTNMYVISEILHSLSSSFSVALWYWTSPKNPNCTMLSVGRPSTCIQTCGPLGFEGAYVFGPLANKGEQKMTIMPMFYSDRDKQTVVVIFDGPPDRFSRIDLGVDYQARSRTIIDRVYDTSSSNGRCFCCQYMVNLRRRVQGRVSEGVGEQRLHLTQMFIQNRRT